MDIPSWDSSDNLYLSARRKPQKRPRREELSMLHRDVADGVHRIGEHFLNWYLVEEGGRLTVVDAGLPASWRSLLGAWKGLAARPAISRRSCSRTPTSTT